MPAPIAPPYRMRLKNLRIRNFRGIDDLYLDFTGPDGHALDMAVVAGANGCGKTSVLEAIRLFIGKEGHSIDGANIHFGADRLELTGEMDWPLIAPGENPGRLELELVSASGDAAPGVLSLRSLQTDTVTRALNMLDMEYYSAIRLPLITKELIQAAQVTTNRSPNDLWRLADLRKNLVNTYYRAIRESIRPSGTSFTGITPFSRVQAWWQHFVPDRELDVLPFSNDPGSDNEVIVHEAGRSVPPDVSSLTMARALVPHRHDIPSIVTMDRLSSGQLAILAFAGPIIFRDQTPDIVLIDEPEQHLHVHWQREILPALRALSPSTQFIIATHSEAILDAALSYERFILVEENDPRTIQAEEQAAPGTPQ